MSVSERLTDVEDSTSPKGHKRKQSQQMTNMLTGQVENLSYDSRTTGLSLFVSLAAALLPTIVVGQLPDELSQQFTENVRPILTKYCVECHSKELAEAEIDLEQFTRLSQLQAEAKTWVKVRVMLNTRQMPPKESKQPTDDEYRQLESWVRTFLAIVAKKVAGDPGPVVLRRLSNDEYNYSLRDLIGVQSLDPTREFPIDGAAGEGFTNTGSGQGMSPALIAKYLDAAKEVADHLVLLPDGIRFSSASTRRDQTDELLAQIREMYGNYTVSATGSPQGGGKIPLARYIAVILSERAALVADEAAVERLAQEHDLSAPYLHRLFTTLHDDDDASIILSQIRSQWKSAKPGDADTIAANIAAWQAMLWKYNTIGHIGREGGPPSWLQAVTPLAPQQDFRLDLPATADKDVIVYLTAGDVGDGNQDDFVVWQNPRLVSVNQPDILLRDAAGIPDQLNILRNEMLADIVKYLAAANAASPDQTVEQLAQRHQVDPILLAAWLNYLDIGIAGPVKIVGHFQNQIKGSANYEFVNNWGVPETPIIGANSSDQEVRVPGIARPHGVFAHPSPTLFAAIGWQSPTSGQIRVEASLSDAHPECGNGVEWFLQHESGDASTTLWNGDFAQGGKATMPPRTIKIRKGEVVSFKLGPRQGSHACDLTAMDLRITEVDGKRTWDLGKDVSDDILAGNPHADLHGNAAVWHFYQGEMKEVAKRPNTMTGVPENSLLAKWLNEKESIKRAELADTIGAFIAAKRPEDDTSPDAQLHDQLQAFAIPLNHERLLKAVEKDPRFGRQPNSTDGDVPANSADLVIQAPAAFELRIPASIAAGRTLVTTARIQAGRKDGSIQAFATLGQPASLQYSKASPIVVTPGSPAEKRVVAGLDEFRNLFPASVCYDRIVPIDEVVTLTLFYREDDHFKRLLLSDEQGIRLDRLWDELHFVSQEPLQYLVALEQIREFATQDRPDLVVAFKANIEPANKRAEAFRQFEVAAEPRQLTAVIDLATSAWRRTASESEKLELRSLYQQLRQAELPHEVALKLTLARILASPDFLYKIENPPQGSEAGPISNHELATRLSYFLWSSLPDAELLAAAERNDLVDDAKLLSQVQRMLDDDKIRRLSIQFACQWLHLRNFDQNDDKNEKLYPEFAQLRDDMYEETVLFFEDMFRNNGSVLHLVDSDHTFLNETMARHYGVAGVSGPQWRRVTGIREKGRGGVLGMATVLASQSGASRTSPILRGNWISETLLGERLPRPPADVPQLPEAVPEGLTARQLIERHSSDPACAKCHARIDPYGFALEGYDAIGRARNGPVDTKTTLLEGEQIEGLDGIRDYLAKKRRDDVVRQFCRKLLGFSLGRELQLSDEPLIDEMLVQLRANDFRFHVAIKQIVLSKQFRQIRGSE